MKKNKGWGSANYLQISVIFAIFLALVFSSPHLKTLRLESVVSCLKHTVDKSPNGKGNSRCRYEGNAACYGVTDVSRCASFYNRAVGAYPVPALQLLPENVYFEKTTREVFVSPTVRDEEEQKVPNILAVTFDICFRRPNMPRGHNSDGCIKIECEFASPPSDAKELALSTCSNTIPQNVYTDETTVIELSGHFMPPDWSKKRAQLESKLLLYNLTAPDLRNKKEGVANSDAILLFQEALDELLDPNSSAPSSTETTDVPGDQPKYQKSWIFISQIKEFSMKHFLWIICIGLFIFTLVVLICARQRIYDCINKRRERGLEKKDQSNEIEMEEPVELGLEATALLSHRLSSRGTGNILENSRRSQNYEATL